MSKAPEPSDGPRRALLETLRATVGPTHVLTDDADTRPYLEDWRERYRGRAIAVVRPRTVDETAAVMRIAHAARVAIVPQGGNTGMCGGATPDQEGNAILLSLGRLDAIRNVDADNATLTAEAGVTLARVQAAAAAAGLLFPLSLASEGSCTIGGNLSTNAGGTAVLRYGNMRDLTLGLEVVLPDGEVWSGLRGLRKDNTGYDVKQLFIGAEGTLGIITAAVLKLFPMPRARATAFAAVTDLEHAVALLRALRLALGDRLTGFELLSEVCIELVQRHMPGVRKPIATDHAWYALVEAHDSVPGAAVGELLETALADAAESSVIEDAVVARSDTQSEQLWALRENVSEAQKREGQNIKHDVAVPISAVPGFVEACNAALAAAFPGVRPVVFGHLGDGNLHYNVAPPPDVDDRAFLAATGPINLLVHDQVAALGGSFSAEHGLGQLKRDELPRYKSRVELDLMRAIKRALDPESLMNPGKVL